VIEYSVAEGIVQRPDGGLAAGKVNLALEATAFCQELLLTEGLVQLTDA
jgi:hypothetical protein